MFDIYCRRYDDWYAVPSRGGCRTCSWCGDPLGEHPTENELIEAYYESENEADDADS